MRICGAVQRLQHAQRGVMGSAPVRGVRVVLPHHQLALESACHDQVAARRHKQQLHSMVLHQGRRVIMHRVQAP